VLEAAELSFITGRIWQTTYLFLTKVKILLHTYNPATLFRGICSNELKPYIHKKKKKEKRTYAYKSFKAYLDSKLLPKPGSNQGFFNREMEAGCWWLTPEILATPEAEIRRIAVQKQPRQIVYEILSRKKSSQKGWQSGLR
jgi:hypothetical protein